MARSLSPLVQCYRADLNTNAVTSADIPVNRHASPMNTKLLWRFNRSPDVMTIMLIHDFPVLLEIRIDRQNLTTCNPETFEY